MLLSLMRKHAKSWLIKFLIAIIAIVFIFYFGYSFTSDEMAKIAEVNGEVISRLEYENAYRSLITNLQQQYQDMWSDNLIEVFDLKNNALESLIEQKIVKQEAEKIGLGITDDEIRETILEYPAFQYNGSFDESRYRALLANNRIEPEDFEKTVANELLQQKLTQFLLTFLVVSEQEVLDQYTYLNQKVKISFVQFSSNDFKDSIDFDQVLMERYFEEHKEEYRIPEKIKISYIAINPEDFRHKVVLDEQEVRNFYEDNLEMYKQEKEVKARHILFSVSSDASPDEEEEVKERALWILERARSGDDFSELAKEYSEGPTGPQGGDLGYFSKGKMLEPFDTVVFSMEKGEISDLVRTTYGYHIIKLEDIREERIKDFDEVREEISDLLIDNEASDIANERALSLIDQMPYDVDLAQYAEEHDVTAITTDYFSQYQPIALIEGDTKLIQSIFSLQKNEVSELIEFNDSFLIIQIVDKKPSYLPELNEVSYQVEEDYIEDLAILEAKSAAEKYLAELKAGADWDELAENMGMEHGTTGFFGRLDYPEEIGVVSGLNEAAFNLSENNRYHDAAFEKVDGALVIRWEGEQGIDEEKYQKEKDQYSDSLMLSKSQALYNSWLARLEEKADIDRSPFERYK